MFIPTMTMMIWMKYFLVKKEAMEESIFSKKTNLETKSESINSEIIRINPETKTEIKKLYNSGVHKP